LVRSLGGLVVRIVSEPSDLRPLDLLGTESGSVLRAGTKFRGLLPRGSLRRGGAMQGFAVKLPLASVGIVAVVLAFLLSMSAEAEPAPAAEVAEVVEVQPGQPKARNAQRAKRAKGGVQKGQARAKVPVAGGPADEAALWWNDPGIQKAMSLTSDQRKKIDAILATYRANVPAKTELAKFHELLVQRDWKQAVAESEKIADRARTGVRMRGQLKIDVFSVLTAEQHQTLVDKFPRLVYKPWTRAMRGTPQR
jgi:Spy/CpxP family protein refolding chaperone